MGLDPLQLERERSFLSGVAGSIVPHCQPYTISVSVEDELHKPAESGGAMTMAAGLFPNALSDGSRPLESDRIEWNDTALERAEDMRPSDLEDITGDGDEVVSWGLNGLDSAIIL